jgi:hypothetical protein
MGDTSPITADAPAAGGDGKSNDSQSTQDEPVQFREVFREEWVEIRTRRRVAGIESAKAGGAAEDVDVAGRPPPKLVGLAFSGGGIRSATVCLGVLQALEKLKLLRIFDYLSTVSGGGFVGGWWSAWLSRQKALVRLSPEHVPPQLPPDLEYDNCAGVLGFSGKMTDAKKGELLKASTDPAYKEAVEQLYRQSNDLFPIPEQIEPERSGHYVSGAALKKVAEGSISAGSDPIHHLRLYANYLTPRKGFLSGDTWLAAAVVSRNLVLTWLILLPVLFAAVMVGRIFFVLEPGTMHLDGRGERSFASSDALWNASGQRETPPTTQQAGSESEKVQPEERVKAERAIYWRQFKGRLAFAAAIPAAMLALLVFLTFMWLRTVQAEVGRGAGLLFLAPIMLGAILVLSYVIWLFRHHGKGSQGVELLQVGFWFFGGIIAGLVALKWRYPEIFAPNDEDNGHERRNKIIRAHVHVLQLMMLVSAVLALAGFGHLIVGYVFNVGGGWLRAGGWTTLISALAGLLFTSIKGAPAGGADRRAKPSWPAQMVFGVTPVLVLGVLALGAAWAGHLFLEAMAPTHSASPLVFVGIDLLCVVIFTVFWRKEKARLAAWGRPAAKLAMGLSVVLLITSIILMGFDFQNLASLRRLWIGFLVVQVVLLAVAWVIPLGWTTDPNWLSLHAFYKVRLVRAYLGASNPNRGKDRRDITESATRDDLYLHELKNCERGAPYHLVNTTLNLVGGSDLTTAQRHAAYFTLSQLYCGSLRTGYRDSKRYMDGKMTLGTAVAISGAAASPNMGTKTPSAALAMLMTLTNVRLGYWAPTPSMKAWQSPQAKLWPYYTLREFISQTNDLSDYCYLTDGGHFENSALYSLIERGCRYIFLVDCGADPTPCFEDMGDALRRCRMDFGAEIDLKFDPFLRSGRRAPREHLIVGTIRYSPVHLARLGRDGEKETEGIIIWMKPTLTKDEPADVRQYALENDSFPQQTTADQWFDEAQFESYRRLGQHSVEDTLGKLPSVIASKAGQPLPIKDVSEIFEEAKGRFIPAARKTPVRKTRKTAARPGVKSGKA